MDVVTGGQKAQSCGMKSTRSRAGGGDNEWTASRMQRDSHKPSKPQKCAVGVGVEDPKRVALIPKIYINDSVQKITGILGFKICY